jgi:hypothetical protein
MANHSINVRFTLPGTIVTDPGQNQLEVDRGDAITWSFGPGGQDVEVVFQVFFPADGSPPLTGISPFSNPLSPTQGPSAGQTIGPGNVGSTAAAGLYTYKVLSNGQLLHWQPALFTVGSFNANFGGIIIRDPSDPS